MISLRTTLLIGLACALVVVGMAMLARLPIDTRDDLAGADVTNLDPAAGDATGLDIAGMPPLAPRIASGEVLVASSPERLKRIFSSHGFDLASIRRGNKTVPHLLLHDLPEGFDQLGTPDARKRLFIRMVLPLVLRVNQRIREQRAKLEALIDLRKIKIPLKDHETRWLGRLAAFYRTKPHDTATLLSRVAPIPPSLMIAQAAAESGWGSSRFAQEGNALFGQWTPEVKKGMKPKEAHSEMRHVIKAYDRLVDSVWDYARNINTNGAYRELRLARARGERTGLALTEHLEHYSERGRAYIELLQAIIRQNDLAPLDAAKLAERPRA